MKRTLGACLFLLAPLGAAFAQPAEDSNSNGNVAENAETFETPARFLDLFHNDRLSGGWAGARPWLEDRGIEWNLSLTAVYQHNAHGGANTRNAHQVSGSYDLELTLDLGAMGLWEGGTVYVLSGGSWLEGISDSGDVGDYFGVNADAGGDRSLDVAELWLEQFFFDEKVRVRVGKIDLGVDFETNTYANDGTFQFMNNALGNSGNVPFPDVGLGLQVVVEPYDWFYAGAAIADAQADGREIGFRTAFHGEDDFFAVFAFGFLPEFKTAWGRLPGAYRFGLWYDPQRKEQFFNDLGGRRRSVPSQTDDVGFYLSFDQLVFQEHPDEEGDPQGLGMFLRYSFAHDDVNEVEHFWSVGAQYQGLIPSRDDDILGSGVAQGNFSHDLRLTGIHPTKETVLELYYNALVLPWLSISPDFQWILNPGGEDGRNALVAGLRFQMAF